MSRVHTTSRSSRLHFIGTWRDNVQRIVAEAIAARHAKSGKRGRHHKRRRAAAAAAVRGDEVVVSSLTPDDQSGPESSPRTPGRGVESQLLTASTLTSSASPARSGEPLPPSGDVGAVSEYVDQRAERPGQTMGTYTDVVGGDGVGGGPRGGRERVIVHVDMDCFFASVALLSRPDLVDKPVAVAHSGTPRHCVSVRVRWWATTAHPHAQPMLYVATGGVAGDGAARGGEISSANYVARAFGVRAGTFVRTAKQKCPDLVVLPYDFARIKQVSETVYRMFCRVRAHRQTLRVAMSSCLTNTAWLLPTGGCRVS